MRHFFLLILAFLFLRAEEAKMIRYPAISPNAKQIAFSYMGDLWLVSIEGGQALRLTVHEGYDYKPMWSPNGERIAFISDRFGNDNIFSIKADGTDLKRHTFTPNDYLVSWHGNNELLFITKIVDTYHRNGELYSVSLNSETAKKFLAVPVIDAIENNTEETLFYVAGAAHKWRKRYRGAANNDIYAYNYKAKSFTQYTSHLGNDLYPMPSNEGLYYVSDKTGFFNLHLLQVSGEDISLTSINEDGINFASMSKELIVYCNNSNVFIYETKSKLSKKLTIFTSDDFPYLLDENKQFSSTISDLQIAPNDDEMAIVYHGELYSYKKDEKENGRIARLTNSPFNDKTPIWNAKSDVIYYLSNAEGQFNVYKMLSSDKKPLYLSRYFKSERLSFSDKNESQLSLSPDGHTLAYVRGLGDLVLYTLATKTEKIILKSWNLSDYSWSPDSKLIAYSQSDENFNSDVYIISLTDLKTVNVSSHPDNDRGVIWSVDGKKIAFNSRRYASSYDVVYCYLLESDANKTKDDWDLEEEFKKLKKEDKRIKKKDDSLAVQVQIDSKDMYKRIVRLTNNFGNESIQTISKDGKTFFYTQNINNESDLFSIDEWDKKPEELTKGNTNPNSVQIDTKYKTLYFYDKNGSVQSISLKGADKKTFKYSGVFTQNKMAERYQAFLEGWNVLNDQFYDANFHGANWGAVKKDYAQKISFVKHERDFSDLMNMMLGELNSSHMGYSTGPLRSAEQVGHLGILTEPVAKGVKIIEILKNSPAEKAEKPLKVGDIISEINGEKISNFYKQFKNENNKLTELKILRNQESLTENYRSLSFPIVTGNLFYEDYINKNRIRVHEKSNDRFAYIHIRSMDISSLEEFESELFAEAEGKEALIIDVRFNGGGFTADFLLNILSTSEHAYTIPRNGEKGYPQDRRTFYSWKKPIVVLTNEYSYSNAEIFAHAIKTLNRGKIIGTPTFGAVISTGSAMLLNGGSVRVPFRGWYNIKTGINQELNGCEPDILVIPKQDEIINNKDSQLERAILELLKK